MKFPHQCPLEKTSFKKEKENNYLRPTANSHLWSNVPISLCSLPLTTQTSERGKKGAGNLALRFPFFCTTARICFLPVGSMRIELGCVPGALKYRETMARRRVIDDSQKPRLGQEMRGCEAAVMNQRLQVRTRRYWKECWTAGAGLCCVTACRGRLGLLIDLEADGGKVCP